MIRILLRGKPKAGKTTLVKKVLTQLKRPYSGFFTEEILKNGKRVGFKIVTSDGREGILAHISKSDFPALNLFQGKKSGLSRILRDSHSGSSPESTASFPHNEKVGKVSKYYVNLSDFERVALPAIEAKKGLIVIDEIGKMELFSQEFKNCLSRIFQGRQNILATIPICRLDFIEKLKELPKVTVFDVTPDNRDSLVSEILDLIEKYE